MVGPCDARYGRGSSRSGSGQRGRTPKAFQCRTQKASGSQIGNKTEEVTTVGVSRMKADWIALASLRVGVIADGFERKHRDHIFTPFTAALGVYVAAHGGCLKIWRLFICKEYPV